MSYLKYKAEKGAAGLLWYFIKIALLACVLLWPLAIGSSDNYKHLSVVGIVLEVIWLLVVGAVAVTIGANRRSARRR
jgi:hypothetical protein